MWRSLASGLAALAALVLGGGAAIADPAAPQLSPLPGHREDAQRLRDQLRELDREPGPKAAAVTATAPLPTTPAEPVAGSSGSKVGGVVLLSVAAASGIATLGLLASASPGPNGSNYDTAETVLGITAAASATLGVLLLIKSQQVQVAPTVTPRAIGLAISGRL